MYRLESLGGHGDLYNYILAESSKLACLGYHTGSIGCNDLGTYGAVNDSGYLLDNADEISSLACDERRVCGNTADNAELGGCAYVLNMSCIDKKLHCNYL